VGNLTYENNVLYQIAHDEGRINALGAYEYDIIDYAGNMRVTFRDSSGIAKIVTKLDYDPWGLRLKGLDYYANNAIYNKFKTFSGKQLHDDFGFNLLSYKFRYHDPALGRFISIDPLAEQYSYNSTFAFAENKLGLGVEYEGLELVRNPLDFTGTGNRYTFVGSSSSSGSKLGVSANASVGLQVGAVEKVYGMGFGAYANVGSVEIGNIQIDAVDGSKGELATEKGNLSIKQGGEVLLGVVGFERNIDRNFSEKGNKLEVKKSTAFSIGPVKVSTEKVENFEKTDGKYTSKGSNSNTIVTIGETKSTNAFIVKGEAKAEASVGMSPNRIYDNRPWESRSDATRVNNNKVISPIKQYPQF
jgi:RHS repeat-associated protein